jgi:hypothetical protein
VLFLPLLAGGFFGGIMTARGEALRVLVSTLAALCGVSAVIVLTALAGGVLVTRR